MVEISRRAQAAMEFLITYGWAILVVLVAVSALAYFTGFFEKYIPSQCAVQPPWYCAEFKASKTDINDANGTLVVGLQPTGDMDYVGVTLFCGKDALVNTSSEFYGVRDQQRINASLVYFSCPMSGSAFNAGFKIVYSNSGETVKHDSIGSLRVPVE